MRPIGCRRSIIRPKFRGIGLFWTRRCQRERTLMRWNVCGSTMPAMPFTLETLDLPAEQRALLQEGMRLAGATDLLSFLLASGEREARSLKTQARRHENARYATVPTSTLRGMKTPEASVERFRRAVYAI